MDHANIAKIFDGGIVGEKAEERSQKAEGEATRSADSLLASSFSLHTFGYGRPCIIHRDIKPSNILVTLHDGVPVPKVIEFGIAKATQQELTDKTLFTHFQQFIGTPAYISPEQAELSGLDVDTRADIYSLGVLLYELLVGQTPFDAKEMMKGGLDALFDAAMGRQIGSFYGHHPSAIGIAFSPDGPRLISTCKGREAVKLWDVGTGQELLTLAGADAFVHNARWSTDGDVIIARPAVAGLERTVFGGNRRSRGAGPVLVRLRRARQNGDQAAISRSCCGLRKASGRGHFRQPRTMDRKAEG